MPRIRYIKPDFFSDEDLAELPFETRLAFAGLWCYADKEGKLEDRPKYLKAMIFPYDNIDFEKQLILLSKPKKRNGKPFIQRYEVDGKKYIQILTWEKHQKPHHTETNSKIPPIPPLIEKGMGMEKQLEASWELNNREITVKEPLNNSLNSSFLEAEGKFKDFWDAYPIRNGRKAGKKECLDFFKKNFKDNETIDLLICATKNYAESKEAKENFARDPIRFLKKDFWRDWINVPLKSEDAW